MHGDMQFCRIGKFFGYSLIPLKLKSNKPCECSCCGAKYNELSPHNSASNEDIRMFLGHGRRGGAGGAQKQKR